MLSVRMLGPFIISHEGRRVTVGLGPSGRILSGFLFQNIGRVHRREKLADLFWGHLDPERSRAALNTALWRLRKLLSCDPESRGGKSLVTNGSEIVLEPAPWLEIDSHGFTAAMSKSLDSSGSNEETHLSSLEAATQRYFGPFLEGDDADWILQERERLHSLYVRGMMQLVRNYGAVGRFEDAIEVARKILAADPFRESVHRELALLLVLNGQRAQALLHHERWCAAFKNELGIDPMPETLGLIKEIRSGEIFGRIENITARYFQPVEKHR